MIGLVHRLSGRVRPRTTLVSSIRQSSRAASAEAGEPEAAPVQGGRALLVAEERSVDGSRHSRRLRQSRWVPSVMYGGDGNKRTLIQLSLKELSAEIRAKGSSFENTRYTLEVGGQQHEVVPRQLQLHPVTDEILSVNFMKFKLGMKLDIPLRTVNDELSPAIRRGAFYLAISKTLRCKVLGDNVPPFLQVDLDGAPNKSVLRLEHIHVPESLQVHNPDPNFVAGTIVGKRIGLK